MIPSGVAAASASIAFVCPQCRAPLRKAAEGYDCAPCARRYPFRFGFPDFRLGDVPDVDTAGDLRAAALLAELEPSSDFRRLAAAHFAGRPAVSAQAQATQLAHFEAEREQAERAMDCLAPDASARAGAFLDLGCGMGRYVAAGAAQFAAAAGVDASFCQLILARKLLTEAGLSAILAAAQVERLPFDDGAFAAIAATDLIEHLDDPAAAVAEVGRVTAPGGRFFAAVPNRYRLTPEPHVGVWGLGYLPRRRAEAYVEQRFGIDYRHIRPPSLRRFRALLSAFPGESRVVAPAPGPQELATFSPARRAAAQVYLALRRLPAVLAVAPYFQGWAVRK